MRKLFLFALVALLGAAQDLTFKDEVKLVQVYATVFDHHGQPVDGLKREQFEIRDDGAPQAIRIFEATDKSVSCALLLDTTASMTESIPTLRNAARNFISALRDGDAVGVYTFNERLDELAEIGTDKAVGRRVLTRLHATGRTALFDSISQLALLLEKRPGKKAIVVLTDGGDNASVLNRQSAAKRARKAGIPVFAIAEGDALHDSAAFGLLRDLTESTGGHLYKAEHPKDIDAVFAEITTNLQSGYLLAFQAPVEANNPPWHELQILVNNTAKSMKVRARTGYSTD
jgi:Ca-activated chloride channel family protein